LICKFKKIGLMENTLIFFMSDNGGDIPYSSGRNYPLRGSKFTVFEGGHKVRSFIYDGGQNLKKYTYDGMFHSVDWLPTILNAALDVDVGKF
jgi:arylsulfatase B